MKKFTAILITISMILMMIPNVVIAASIDSKVEVSGGRHDPIWDREDLRFSGMWRVEVDDRVVTQGIGVKDLIKKTKEAPNYIFILKNEAEKVVKKLGGDKDFVDKYLSSLITIVEVDGKKYETIYISYLAHLCGALPGRYGADRDGGGYQEIEPTPGPSAMLSLPSSAKEGEEVDIGIRARTYVQFSHPKFTPLTGIYSNQMTIMLKVDGKREYYNTVWNRNFSDEISYEFDEAGEYGIELTVTDAVGRTATESRTIEIEGKSKPPSSPGRVKADLEMELDPSRIKSGNTETVLISLDASDIDTPGTGPIHYRWWVKKNGEYINEGGSSGYKNEYDPTNPRYYLYAFDCEPGDEIWAEVSRCIRVGRISIQISSNSR